MVPAINSAESLPNRPVLSEPVKLQLAPPKLEFLQAGLPEAVLNKQSSTSRCAVHFLKTLHLPEMPDSIQDQLEKVESKPRSHHRETPTKSRPSSV